MSVIAKHINGATSNGTPVTVDLQDHRIPDLSSSDNNKVIRIVDGSFTFGADINPTLYTVTGTITNTSGSYSGTISNSNITSDMVVIGISYGTPSVFKDDVHCTCVDGGITVACSNVVGTSTVSMKVLGFSDELYESVEGSEY